MHHLPRLTWGTLTLVCTMLTISACHFEQHTSAQAQSTTATNLSHQATITQELTLGTLQVGDINAPKRGLLITPNTQGAHPLIVISHLRAPNCSEGEFAYPCSNGQEPLRFDYGMHYLGETLAQAGYAVLIPDLSVIYQGDSLDEPYDQKALWRSTLSDFLTHLKNGADAHRFDFEKIGLLAHSRSGEMVHSAVELLGQRLGGVLAYGAAADAYDIAVMSPAPADVPYLSLLGALDKDVDKTATQWLGHWITQPREHSASVVTIPALGHNYVNRTLSDLKIDDRIGCDILACADAKAHEAFLSSTAVDWFNKIFKNSTNSLPLTATDPLPNKIYGTDINWLSATPKALAHIPYSAFTTDTTGTVMHCRHNDPMSPRRLPDACPEPELGVVSTVTHVALLTDASATVKVSGARGMAIHLSPWGSDERPTKVNITLESANGKQAHLSIAADTPALYNQASELDNGTYQLSTLRLTLPDALHNETITKLRIHTDGNQIELRSVDFY